MYCWKQVLTVFCAMATAGACRAAEDPPPRRLPDQQHNLMLYIKTEDRPAIYVDVANHYDVGSPRGTLPSRPACILPRTGWSSSA
jgi:hypothetical protein